MEPAKVQQQIISATKTAWIQIYQKHLLVIKNFLEKAQVILLPWMETYFYNQDLDHLRKRDLGLLRNLRKRDLALLRKDWRGLLAMRARP